MTEYDKVTTWAVTDALRIYENGKLLAEIEPVHFSSLVFDILGELGDKPLTWAGTDKLRAYLNGKLVDKLQGHEVANLILECAKVLRR